MVHSTPTVADPKAAAPRSGATVASPADMANGNGEVSIPRGLAALLDCGDFDSELLAPTSRAVLVASRILAGAGVSEPAFSTIGDGSIYMRWKSGGREVRVLVPPVDQIPVRLYYSDGTNDGVESGVTSALLSQRVAERF